MSDTTTTQSDKENTQPESFDEAVSRLADLPVHEYDPLREDMAKRFNVRVGTLDDEVRKYRRQSNEISYSTLLDPEPDPWGSPIDGHALIAELVESIRTYVVLPKGCAEAIALYIMHTYHIDHCTISPKLMLQSPEKGCGKTTALSVIGLLASKALPAANITSAAIFRTVQQVSPTLILDEGDSFISQKDELYNILNCSHHRDTAFVVRVEGDNREPRRFYCFTPVVIAAIGRLASTLEDRSIIIPMRRAKQGERTQKLRPEGRNQLGALKRKIMRYMQDNADVIAAIDVSMPEGLSLRAEDNWEPLLMITEHISNEWPERMRDIAIALSTKKKSEDGSVGIQLLQDIHGIFEERKVDRIYSAELCNALVNLEDRPWAEHRNDRPITSRGIAKILNPFGIHSKDMRIPEKVSKGYERSAFGDAFDRYLGIPSATTLQASDTNDLNDNQSATDG